MKKLLFIAILLFSICFTMKAQEVGQKWIGGGIGFSSKKTSELDRANNFRFKPEIGYQISENMGLGVNLGYTHEEASYQDYYGKYKSILNGFEINPFVRYTFYRNNIISIFTDSGAGFSYLREAGDEGRTRRWNIGFRPGIALNVSNNVAFTGKIGFFGYNHSKYDSGYNYDITTKEFKADLDMSQILFGVNVIF